MESCITTLILIIKIVYIYMYITHYIALIYWRKSYSGFLEVAEGSFKLREVANGSYKPRKHIPGLCPAVK